MFTISLLSGLALCSFYSKLIFKKINLINIILSAFIITAPIQLIAFLEAKLIAPYIYILFAIFATSILLKIKFTYRYIKKAFNLLTEFAIKKENIFINLISLLLTLFLTYKLFPNVWRFEDHDILYFGWLNGIFNIDYEGPIRIPTAYPYQMSANHLTAGSLLIPFMMFSKANLINSYKIKFALITITLFSYIKNFNRKNISLRKDASFQNIIIGNSLLFTSFIIFISEFDYSLGISNYPLILLILTFTNYCIVNLNKPELFHDQSIYKYLLIFPTLLCISKSVTFPIFVIAIAIILFKFRDSYKIKSFFSNNYKIIFLALLILGFSIIGWLIQVSNHGSIGGAFPICILDGASQIKGCLSSLFKSPFGNWTIPSNLFRFISKNLNLENIKGLEEFVFIWGICILPCIALGYGLRKIAKDKISLIFSFFVISYSLATAIGILFLRESIGYDGRTTAHGYLIMHILSITSIQMIYLNSKIPPKLLKSISLISITFLILGTISYNSAWSLTNQRFQDLKRGDSEYTDRVSLTVKDMNNFSIEKQKACTSNENTISLFNNFLDEKNCDKGDIKHLLDSMKGVRSNAALLDPQTMVDEWILR